MSFTPHKDKVIASISNPKCSSDKHLLEEVLVRYVDWVKSMKALTSSKKERVDEMVKLLNDYKDFLEVEIIAKRGSAFLKRQKGQLKLDNSVLEEFLIYLVNPLIIDGLPNDFKIDCGPHTAFMSLSFRPEGIASLNKKPSVVLKQKDQDFTLGKKIHYQFSSSATFDRTRTTTGDLYLSVFAAEIKVNYDKTMFQECGDKQVEDLNSLWTNPWNPQDQIILDSLGDLKGKRVLLLGNGHSKKEMYLLTMKPQALVYSDLSLNAVANIRDEFNLSTFADSIKFASLDAQQLPFADECIDIIYGYAIVHHLPDLPRFFSEVTRVLSKDGFSIFMDDAYAPIWHYSKQTFLRPLMKYSHRTSGISPEDYRFTMSGGFREKILSEQIKTAGGVPWFKRTAFLQYFWSRGVGKIFPKRIQHIAMNRSLSVVLIKIDNICAKLPFVKFNLIRLVWGIKKKYKYFAYHHHITMQMHSDSLKRRSALNCR